MSESLSTDDRQALLETALGALRAGVAMADKRGRIAFADARFLALHGLDAIGDEHLPWPDLIGSGRARLDAVDATAAATVWAAMIDDARRGKESRLTFRLADGPGLLVTCTPAGSETVVLTAMESGAVADHARAVARLQHQINNALGGMLANLHLALADLEAGHPVRQRLEAISESAMTLRALAQPDKAKPAG